MRHSFTTKHRKQLVDETFEDFSTIACLSIFLFFCVAHCRKDSLGGRFGLRQFCSKPPHGYEVGYLQPPTSFTKTDWQTFESMHIRWWHDDTIGHSSLFNIYVCCLVLERWPTVTARKDNPRSQAAAHYINSRTVESQSMSRANFLTKELNLRIRKGYVEIGACLLNWRTSLLLACSLT